MNEEKIIRYWENQERAGVIPEAAYRGQAANDDCGDTVYLDICVIEDRIVDAKHYGGGCVLSQAGASMLTEFLLGKRLAEASSLTAFDMLSLFEGSPAMKNRLECCLLPLQALNNLLEKRPCYE